MKIVYPYKCKYDYLKYYTHDYDDDSNRSVCKYTDRKCNDAYSHGIHMEELLKEYCDFDLKNKKVLDVGMGTGDILSVVRNELKADVFGVDLFSYIRSDNYVKDRTFCETDVRNVPKEWHNTFDMAYQILYSVPIKQTLSVLKAIAECLKTNGLYYVTFYGLDEEYYSWEDSFTVKILKELYHNVDIFNDGRKVLATNPRKNPTLTPMDEYYYILTKSQYEDCFDCNDEIIQKKLSMYKSINKEKGIF